MGARSRGRFNRGPSPPDLAVAVWGTCLGLYESVSGFLALPSRGIERKLVYSSVRVRGALLLPPNVDDVAVSRPVQLLTQPERVGIEGSSVAESDEPPHAT